MKKILITGTNSFVGNSFTKWLERYPNTYKVETISLRDGSWVNKQLSEYDVILHVAGIAHVSSNPKMEELYKKVNTDLTIQLAKKAKAEGVKQIVFMSSIKVYGDKAIAIDKETIENPTDYYGKSKLKAEEGLRPLNDSKFKVAIIRSPMIYGKYSKGNYPKLAKLAMKLPIFPDIDNQRSMIHIDNLCELIRLIIDNKDCGIFYPQNEEYVKTSELVKLIAEVHGKKIRLTKMFNPFIKILIDKINVLNKVFGNLFYKKELSDYKINYRIRNLRESIELTEK